MDTAEVGASWTITSSAVRRTGRRTKGCRGSNGEDGEQGNRVERVSASESHQLIGSPVSDLHRECRECGMQAWLDTLLDNDGGGDTGGDGIEDLPCRIYR